MKKRMLATMLMLCLAGVGCGRHYEEHRVEDIAARAGGSLSELSVSLPEGAVLTAKLTPLDNDDEPMRDPEVRSDAPDIVEVLRVSDGTEVHFAFVGRGVGETSVRYFAEGQEVRRERARVTAR